MQALSEIFPVFESLWFNQYITFFVTEHSKFISACFKGSVLKYRYNELGSRLNLNFWPPFCFEMDKVTSY